MLKKNLILLRSLEEAFSENSVKFSDCRAFSLFNTVPGCRAFRHSVMFMRFQPSICRAVHGVTLRWWKSVYFGSGTLRAEPKPGNSPHPSLVSKQIKFQETKIHSPFFSTSMKTPATLTHFALFKCLFLRPLLGFTSLLQGKTEGQTINRNPNCKVANLHQNFRLSWDSLIGLPRNSAFRLG